MPSNFSRTLSIVTVLICAGLLMAGTGLGRVEPPGDCGSNDNWARIFALAVFLLPMGVLGGF